MPHPPLWIVRLAGDDSEVEVLTGSWRRIPPSRHGCDTMTAQVSFRCDDRPDPNDCPDALVAFREASGEDGLYTHDGGSAWRSITFCPWCGSRLGEP